MTATVSKRSICMRRLAGTALMMRRLVIGVLTAQNPPAEKEKTPASTISLAMVVRGKYASPLNQMAKSVIVQTMANEAGGKRTERPKRNIAMLHTASNAIVSGSVIAKLPPIFGGVSNLRVPHISLVFREMWDTTALDRPFYRLCANPSGAA